MAGADYKGALAWAEAMDVALKLNRLSDELPQPDAEFLSRGLRQSGLDILQDVAIALSAQRPPNPDHLLTATVTLELVDRTYPALDTGTVATALTALSNRYDGDFAARRAIAVPPPSHQSPEDQTESAEGEDEDEATTDNTDVLSPANVAVPVAQEDDSVHADNGQ